MRHSSHQGTGPILFYILKSLLSSFNILFYSTDRASSCVCLFSGKSDYVEPAKRAHIMAAPRGRGGRGGFGQNLCRPHDIFRQRKQNTSRPPSMHVDDFVAAEFKDIATPLGLLPPKRPPKSSPKPPTRGLFTGNRGRATFHSQTRFFTPPQPKGVLLSGMYTHTHTQLYWKDDVCSLLFSLLVNPLIISSIN